MNIAYNLILFKGISIVDKLASLTIKHRSFFIAHVKMDKISSYASALHINWYIRQTTVWCASSLGSRNSFKYRLISADHPVYLTHSRASLISESRLDPQLWPRKFPPSNTSGFIKTRCYSLGSDDHDWKNHTYRLKKLLKGVTMLSFGLWTRNWGIINSSWVQDL